jgi:hypothetical protein
MIPRCSAVRLPDERVKSSGVPAATTCPPSSPASGPISTTQSLAATTLYVVFYDDNRITGFGQTLKLRRQPFDVRRM